MKIIAKATLKAVASGLSLSEVPVYPDIDGFIGTNGKKYKQNILKNKAIFLEN